MMCDVISTKYEKSNTKHHKQSDEKSTTHVHLPYPFSTNFILHLTITMCDVMSKVCEKSNTTRP